MGDLQKVYVGRNTYSDGNKYEAILVYTNSDSDSDEKVLYCKLDGLTFKNGKLQGADNYRITSDGDVDDMLQLKKPVFNSVRVYPFTQSKRSPISVGVFLVKGKPNLLYLTHSC